MFPEHPRSFPEAVLMAKDKFFYFMGLVMVDQNRGRTVFVYDFTSRRASVLVNFPDLETTSFGIYQVPGRVLPFSSSAIALK